LISRIIFLSVSIGTFFGSEVFGQEAAPKETFSPLIGILLRLAVFFFLIILPQSRKAKKHSRFLADLQKGDSVLTQSGIYGTIYGIAERVITLEVAPNVRIRVDRQSISTKDQIGKK